MMTAEAAPTMVDRQGDAPRILVVASTYPRWRGDTEPGFVHELARRLTDEFDMLALVPHARGARGRECMDGVNITRYRYAPERLESLVSPGGMTVNLRRNRAKWLLVPGFVLAQAVASFRLIRCFRPQVIHAHWLIPQGAVMALLSVLWRRCPPFIVTSHGADLFAFGSRYFRPIKRWVLRRAAAVTVVSNAMAKIVRELDRCVPVHVMPMGTDLTETFVPPDDEARRAADTLVFAGRLVEKKGVEKLLDALPRLVYARPDLSLVIAGDGPLRERLERHAEHLGIAEFVDFRGALSQDRLAELFRRATLAVFPFVVARGGDQEGFGLVVAEAMGCACPVVAGDVAAVRDLVEDGQTGVLVDAADSAALVARIDELLADKQWRQMMGSEARKRVVARCSWQATARAYARLLNTRKPT